MNMSRFQITFAVPAKLVTNPVTSQKHLECSRPTCATMSAPDKPSGPHTVAICDCRLSDDFKSPLRLRLFYPTPTPSSQGRPAQWLPPSPDPIFHQGVVSMLRYSGLPYPKVLSLPLSFLASRLLPAVPSGPLLHQNAPHPLMIFSHGLGGSIANYSNFCIDRASHGFIVAAPEHTDGSAFEAVLGSRSERLPYAKFDYSKPGANERAFRMEQLETRFEDLANVIRTLTVCSTERQDNEDQCQQIIIPLRPECPVPNLQGSLDLSNTVVAGHSFGAATALLYGTEGNHPGLDSPPGNIICLDGWFNIIEEQIKDLTVPPNVRVLFIDMGMTSMKNSMETRKLLPLAHDESEIGRRIDAITVVGGTHSNASDIPIRIPAWMASTAGLTVSVESTEYLVRQNRATHAFLSGFDAWTRFRDEVERGHQTGLVLGQVSRSNHE